MRTYSTSAIASSAVVNSPSPRAELQRQGTNAYHGIRRHELEIGIVYALEVAAMQAGLSELEAKAILRCAFEHARAGVIRTGRKRPARGAAA